MTAPAGRVDVAVVGAGLAGLVAARRLQAAGARVVLADKGRRPGGRCATRPLHGATCDSGAQFFTVRSDAFTTLVDDWREEGVPVRVWGHGWAHGRHVDDGPEGAREGEDGHPRHAVTGGMNVLAAHLARELDVRSSQRVLRLDGLASGWHVTAGDVGTGAPWELEADRVLCTTPLPQALALVDRAGIPVAATLRARSGYEPTLALLLALDAPPGLPAPGGVQLEEGPVSWLGDNQAKGASATPALTVHAASTFSRERFDDAAASADLLAAVRPWLGGARVRGAELFRWRYAQPSAPVDEGAVDLGDGLILAGDAHAGSKVEGAVRSGLAAALLTA